MADTAERTINDRPREDSTWSSIAMRPWPEQPDTVGNMAPVWAFDLRFDNPRP